MSHLSIARFAILTCLSAPAFAQIVVARPGQDRHVTHRVRPVYPDLAKQARIHGFVRLAAIIGDDGTIQYLKLISGHPFLAGAAMDAVKQWRYQPVVSSTESLPTSTIIELHFSFDGRQRWVPLQ